VEGKAGVAATFQVGVAERRDASTGRVTTDAIGSWQVGAVFRLRGAPNTGFDFQPGLSGGDAEEPARTVPLTRDFEIAVTGTIPLAMVGPVPVGIQVDFTLNLSAAWRQIKQALSSEKK
jgi:hypothetical protein